jgi:tetratricopeptide (TPR) repeat protein
MPLPLMDMKILENLDPSMSMAKTLEVITGALDDIPLSEGTALKLTGDQQRVLDLVTEKIKEAEGYYDRPVDDPAIYQRLVAIGSAAGRTDLVEAFGRRTAEIEAADLEFRARLQAFFGATSRAIGLFAQAVELTPDFTEAVDGHDRAQRRVEKSRKKVRVFKEASDAHQGSAKAWVDLGQALADLDEMEKALACFNNAVKLAPTDIAAMCKKGGALAILGRVAEAKECFEAVLHIEPGSLNGKRGLNYTTYMLERM